MRKKIVVVLTIGRSGSSALTRGLKVLGIDLGHDLDQNGFTPNPKGFWEDYEILSLGHEILSSLSTHQFKLDGIGKLKNVEIPNHLHQKALYLIKNKAAERSIFGFKDVLAWKILPFWKDIFSQLNADVTYIVAVRNPISVAASFSKMLSFGKMLPFGKGKQLARIYPLWLESIVTIMTETAGTNRLVVDYDQLLNAPRLQIFRIAETLGIQKLEINEKSCQEYEDAFLDTTLRNHTSSLEDIKKTPFCPQLICDCYQFLQRLATDQLSANSAEAESFFQEYRSKLEIMAPYFESISDLIDGLESIKVSLENAIWQTRLGL